MKKSSVFFTTLFNEELNLSGLSVHDNLTDRRLWLLPFLLISRTNKGKNAALILIKQVVPCTMLTENRIKEKLITMFLSPGAAMLQNE
jgi:hypothetical protein